MVYAFQTSIFQRGVAPPPDLMLTRKMLAENPVAIHPLAAVTWVGVAKRKTCPRVRGR